MKEHKNPKVLSEGILWMVSAVKDFSVSHLKLKVYYLYLHIFNAFHFWVELLCFNTSLILQDLIDFLKETGLQSSAAATRNASTKFLGVLHRFVGPGDCATTFKCPYLTI